MKKRKLTIRMNNSGRRLWIGLEPNDPEYVQPVFQAALTAGQCPVPADGQCIEIELAFKPLSKPYPISKV